MRCIIMSKESDNPFIGATNIWQALEQVTRVLSREGLYAEKNGEPLGSKFDSSKHVPSPKESFQFPHDSFFLTDAEKRASYLFRAALDPEFAGHINRDRVINMSSSLGPFMGPAPTNLRDSLLRKMLEKRAFSYEKSKDHKIETAAFLMERALNTEALLREYAPAFDYNEFHRYQSKINRIIDKKLPLDHYDSRNFGKIRK